MPIADINKYAAVYRKALAENPKDSALNNSIAMCYLKLKLYDKALSAFEKAIEGNFDNSETYFYAAICLLNGKKAFLATRNTIDKIEEYINAALSVEPRPIYYYFQAYIKYDYFSRKYFNTSPTFQEAFQQALDAGLAESGVAQLYDILTVARPDCL
jgi:tetratricopeptide (TPR) repeat protein